MTDHKFEPFQQVLVRHRNYEEWLPMLYGFEKDKGHMCGMFQYSQCIPYTDETAHLLGTTHPYEPPKPLVQYAFGQRVEVLIGKDWETAVFLLLDTNDERVPYSVYGITSGQRWVTAEMVRPLTT